MNFEVYLSELSDTILEDSLRVSKYGILSGPYFPVFGLNTGEYRPEKLRIWTFSGQWLWFTSWKS